MQLTLKRKLAIGTTALAAVAFAGGAYAAAQDSTANVRQAFLNDVAKRLKVTPQELTAAFQGAFSDQLRAAVASGKLTQAQANALKQRALRRGGLPSFGAPRAFGPRSFGVPPPLGAPRALGRPRFFGGPRFFGRGAGVVPAASKYLGLSPIQLLDKLGSGKSLAQIAQAQGKTVAGLKAGMTAAERAQLDKARAAKVITSAQEQKLLSRLSTRLDRQINRSGRAPRGLFRGRAGAVPPLPGAGMALPAPRSAPAGASGPAY
jgi:hypothetical protein